MSNLRFGTLYTNGVYHIFNRGVDKRDVFMDKQDKSRFLLLLDVLQSINGIQSIQHLHKADFNQKRMDLRNTEKLVEVISCALLPNHYHLVLRQVSEDGVSKYMHKLGLAYTKYFNEKYERTGPLFAGKYKYIELETDNDIRRIIAYVNKNPEIHKLKSHHMSFSSDTYYRCEKKWEWGNAQWGIGLFDSRSNYELTAEKYALFVIREREDLSLEQ